ncbi:MAG: glycosyltransferase family 4 protein [Pseudomonadota bacterium]
MKHAPLKIVMITPQWLQTKGGPTYTVNSLACKLREKDNLVWVLTCDIGEGALKFSNRPIHREIEIFKLLKLLHPDIIHIHGRIHYVFPAWLYKLVFGLSSQIVFTFHTQPYIQDFLGSLAKGKPDYTGIKRVVAKFLLHRCDKVSGVSHSIISNLNKYCKMGLRRYSVIHTGNELAPVNGDRIKTFKSIHKLQKNFPIISTIGVFAWDWKVAGHQVCIEAINLLEDKYPNIKLLIAGDGPYRQYLENIVRQLNIEDYIIFLGNVDNISEVLSCSDIYAHMAMNEGLGASVIEAMLSMKPIVAANAGGIPEIINHGTSGLLIKPNAQQLERAVEWLIKNPADRLKLGENAYLYAIQSLNWDVTTQKYLNLYLCS